MTLGYGAYDPVKGRRVSEMTLGELKEFQRGMLRNPKNNFNSSAAGKYQIVGKTLRAIQQQMGLGDDVVFDAKTQDAMALHLLKGRGLDKWKSGKMNDAQFQMELAKEWASVARPDTGRSYYGQGTGTSTKAIQDAMRKA